MTRRSFVASLAAAAARPAPAASPRFIKSICNPMIPGADPLPKRFRIAKEAGFEAIELRLGDRETEIPASASLDEVRRLGDDARKAGVEIASLWATASRAGGTLFSAEEDERQQFADHIRTAMRFADELGSKAVLINLGPVADGPKLVHRYEDAWENSTEALEDLLYEAEEREVMLTPENVGNKFLTSPRDMREYVEQFFNPYLQAHFDTGNVMPLGFPQDWILTVAELIKRVHLKDYRLGEGYGTGEMVPLLEGDVDFPAVMKALNEVGYKGYLSPEGPQQPDRAALLEVSRRLDKIIAMA